MLMGTKEEDRMKKKRSAFLEYGIHKRKFLFTVLVVVGLCTIMFLGMLFFFLNTWQNEYYQRVQAQFLNYERKIGDIQSWTNVYIEDLYGNRGAMQDAQALFESTSHLQYLQERRENSLNNTAQIAYLPNDLKRLFLNNRVKIRGVTLENDSGIKAIWMDQVSGSMEISFDLRKREDVESLPQFGDLIIASYQIRDPEDIGEVFGELSFWVKSEDVFIPEQEIDGVWEVVSQDKILTQSELSDEEEIWIENAKKIGSDRETSGNLTIDSVALFRLESSQADYAYLAAIDRDSLLADNVYTILVMGAALILIAVGVIVFSYMGIRQDEIFLTYIMQILTTMEEGDFSRIRKMELPMRQKENEYGMIAIALKDVGLELENYIKTEYILKLKEQETEMRALQHQINPHFLYNTLESIRSQALVSGDWKTADAIEMLGALYRARMNKRKSISLKEEFHFLKLYLQIMQLRFGDSFLYQVELEKEVEEVETLNFWLQPLAENFFTHGYDRESEFNLLIVTGHKEGNGVRIKIVDNGKGIKPEEMGTIRKNMYEGNDDPEADIGLRNVYMRLSYFYPEGFSMEIDNNAESGVGISIFIPGKAGIECTH